MLSNKEFDISQTQQNITSKEAKDLYATCSELLITHRFAKNNISENDAVAIMDFADAYSVLNKNEQAKGICLTNIANIHFKNKNYAKASANFAEAAELAKKLVDSAKANSELSEFNKNIYLYWKRRYYFTISRFF
jgi:tetratricopeptide (TPR) repeat protein